MRWIRIAPYAAIIVFYVGGALALRAWAFPNLEAEMRPLPPEARSYFRIADEVRGEDRLLRDILWRDTVVKIVSATPGIHVHAAPFDSAFAQFITRRIQMDAGMPRDVALEFLSIPGDYGALAAIPQFQSLPRYLAGTKEGVPYCVIVAPVWSNRVAGPLRFGGSVAGPCAFWGRYGQPGSSIHRWLMDGGSEFATHSSSRWSVEEDLDWLEVERRRRAWTSILGQACMAGRPAACEEVVLRGDSVQARHGVAMRVGDFSSRHLIPGQQTLLADLEREFGRERFARFWTSSQDVEPAFHAAFGIGLGEWVVHWSTQRFGLREAGARMDVLTLVLSIVFVVSFAFLAAVIAVRRRV